mgnify:CR=1 FL=1
MKAIHQFLVMPGPVKLLLVNDFTVFVGFYMLYPYLTVYFRDDLGFAASTIGLVLGIRVLCQQGLTIVGGTLADRFSYKPVILSGLAIRATGFAMLGVADSFPVVLAAVILSGFGGAVFSPALRAYLALEGRGQRAEVFALNNVFSQAGTLLGPLIGLALLGLSFQVVALGAGGIFFALMLLQVLYLPSREGGPRQDRPSVLNNWREVLGNRAFLLFSIAMLAQFTLLNQLYLGLPLEIERLTGSQAAVGTLFIVSSLLTILLQVHVTAFCQTRWKPITAISAGLLLMGLAFLPTLFSTAIVGVDEQPTRDTAGEVLVLLPAIAAAALLAIAIMITQPFALEMVPRLGRDRLTATYFGVYSMASGIGATVGNIAIGLSFDKQDELGLNGLPWLLMVALGCGCALFMRILSRRQEFQEPSPPLREGLPV